MYFAPNWQPKANSQECVDRSITSMSHLRLRQNPDGSQSIWLNSGSQQSREILISTIKQPAGKEGGQP
jgi:hypothetical protein